MPLLKDAFNGFMPVLLSLTTSMALMLSMTLVSVLFVAESAYGAGSVKAIALFNERAMLSVDGSKAKIVRVGDTHLGVKVISSNTSEAVVEVAGQPQTLTLNGAMILSKSLAVSPPKSYYATVQMAVDNFGFFRGNGAVNGGDLEFLVDTGANLVVLSSRDADEIGLEYRSGARTNASTAAGNAPMYLVRLQTVSLGGIELENISAGVIVGRFPEIPLLGMSFLSQLNMRRDGDNMTLSRR
ncbi:MAG: aspartyl protease family protein [Cryomorphaceae bacterium]